MTSDAPPGAAPTAPRPASSVLDHVHEDTDLVVPLANGEPVSVLDAVEAAADRLRGVRVHQMHAIRERDYLDGRHGDRLRHVSYFLSAVTRPHFHSGGLDLVPAHFSDMPLVLSRSVRRPLVVAASSMPDRHGFFSLGTNADYVARFIGRWPFYLEANHRMPRTHGHNVVHVSQVVGWTEVDRPLVELQPATPREVDHRIAQFVAERVPDRSTLQVGIGSIPDAVMIALRGHRDLGVHTEMLSDGIMHLVEHGAVTGVHKRRKVNHMVTTFALGTNALYDFLDDNVGVEFLPVDFVNDPRVICGEPNFVSINASTEVDLMGQAASETIAGRYWSGSGGQADFAKGAMLSDGGQGFIVLPSTTTDGTTSRIVARLAAGSVVTTLKNTVDKVVTEWGVAELRGRSLRERARALVDVAHPDFRDDLERQARELGQLRD